MVRARSDPSGESSRYYDGATGSKYRVLFCCLRMTGSRCLRKAREVSHGFHAVLRRGEFFEEVTRECDVWTVRDGSSRRFLSNL